MSVQPENERTVTTNDTLGKRILTFCYNVKNSF